MSKPKEKDYELNLEYWKEQFTYAYLFKCAVFDVIQDANLLNELSKRSLQIIEEYENKERASSYI